MGKITGFLELDRLQEASEAPTSRLKHWREFVLHLSDEQAGKQAARCMDCGIPFCNNGCPVNNIIPDWNDLVFRQNWMCFTRPTIFQNLRGVFAPRLAKRLAH